MDALLSQIQRLKSSISNKELQQLLLRYKNQIGNLSQTQQEQILDIVSDARQEKRGEKKCHNLETPINQTKTGLIEDDQIYFYKSGNVYYCFDHDDVTYVLKSRKNPYTKAVIPDDDLTRMGMWQSTQSPKSNIEDMINDIFGSDVAERQLSPLEQKIEMLSEMLKDNPYVNVHQFGKELDVKHYKIFLKSKPVRQKLESQNRDEAALEVLNKVIAYLQQKPDDKFRVSLMIMDVTLMYEDKLDCDGLERVRRESGEEVVLDCKEQVDVLDWLEQFLYFYYDSVEEIEKLRLKGKSIKELPPNIFDSLTNLTWLDLRETEIKELPPNIFDKLTKLEYLQLGGNEIEELPPNIFDKLTKLEDLSMWSNKIKELPPHIFDKLTELDHLGLAFNKIKELPPHIFDKLTKLKGLDLDNNKIKELPPHIFDELTRLENIALLVIKELPPNLFDRLTNLKRITINGIHIPKLRKNKNLKNVEIVAQEFYE